VRYIYTKEDVIEALETIKIELKEENDKDIINTCIKSIKNDFKEIED
jgi:hypothetical protein